MNYNLLLRRKVQLAIVVLLLLLTSWECDSKEKTANLDTDTHLVAWRDYVNSTLGFVVSVPSHYEIINSGGGISISDSARNDHILILKAPEKLSLYSFAGEDSQNTDQTAYLIFLDHVAEPPTVVRSSYGIKGQRMTSRLILDSLSLVPDSFYPGQGFAEHSITFYPNEFSDNPNRNGTYIIRKGSASAIYDSISSSFRYLFQHINQQEMISKGYIGRYEKPDRAVYYLGQSHGFSFDFDADGKNELLIVGMRRKHDEEQTRGFIRILELGEKGNRILFEKSVFENSFNPQDIRIINVDDQYGLDVMLTFYDYSSVWGKNVSYVLNFTGKEFHFSTFGSFTKPYDVDNNGNYEILNGSTRLLGKGTMATWYDIFEWRDGGFVENNYGFQEFFRSTLIPYYQSQINALTYERQNAIDWRYSRKAYLMHLWLKSYAASASKIAKGESLK